METTQRLPASLTALDTALAVLLDGLQPTHVIDLPASEAVGCVAAETAPFRVQPGHDVALVDGWALRARDFIGASAYSPVPLTTRGHWVEAGDPIPNGCDCVIDPDGL